MIIVTHIQISTEIVKTKNHHKLTRTPKKAGAYNIYGQSKNKIKKVKK